MQKILRKRIGRNLKENKYRYSALCFLIMLGMYMVIRITGAADTIMKGVDERAEKNCVENGSFSVYEKLSEDEKAYLESLGISLEEKFSLDYLLSDNSVIRVFKVRTYINLIELDEGKMPENDDELVIEKRYADEHGYKVGALLSFGNHTYTVSGIGSVPDYDAPYKNSSDTAIDSNQFGLAFLCEVAYEKLAGEKNSLKSEEYEYAYLFSANQGESQNIAISGDSQEESQSINVSEGNHGNSLNVSMPEYNREESQNKIQQFNTIKEKNQVLKTEVKGVVNNSATLIY